MLKQFYFFSVIFFSVVFTLSRINAQDVGGNSNNFLKIFFDTEKSLGEYARMDIRFVQFVRDPSDADVHIMFVTREMANEGKEYSMIFVGRKRFEGKNDTIVVPFMKNISSEEENSSLVRIVKLGLARYLAYTPARDFIDVDVSNFTEPVNIEDVWDNWVFKVSLNGNVEAEKTRRDIGIVGELNSWRITEESKFDLSVKSEIEIKYFDSEYEQSTNYRREHNLDALYVRSISQNWSIGAFTSLESNSYRNINFKFSFSPAVEYNFFPYSQSARKLFAVLYRIGYVSQRYYETTIFNKAYENLFNQGLKLSYMLNDTWGSAKVELALSNYLHDFSKNKIELNSTVSLKIAGGLALDFYTEVSLVHDQLYLPAGKASIEEILLNQRKLETQYEYTLRFGISYTFGSIYNTIVNPRFNNL